MRKDKLINLLKIVKYIEQNPGTYLNEISKKLKLNQATVFRALNELDMFIERTSVNEQFTEINLPQLPITLKLRETATFEGIKRFILVKDKINKK